MKPKPPEISVKTQNYQLQLSESATDWEIKLDASKLPLNTSAFTDVATFVCSQLPSIEYAWCDNPEELSFTEEMKATELGHLFEHILLEYLCQEALHAGCDKACFEGRTYWHLQARLQGLYTIVVNKPAGDHPYFNAALLKSVALFNQVIGKHNDVSS